MTVLVYGEWWIETRKRPPKNYKPPKHTTAGELSAEGMSGWTLETIGSLTAQPMWSYLTERVVDAEDELVTVRGADSSARSYSLLGCYDIQSITQGTNIRDGVQRWGVGTIIEGHGIWVDPDTQVNEITISFRDLTAWATDARNSPFDFDRDARVVTFHWEWNKDEGVAQDCGVELRHGFSWSSSDRRFAADASAVLKISDTLEVQDIADKWIRPINELMSLLAMRPSFPTGIRACLVEKFGRGRAIEVDIRVPQPMDGLDDEDAEEGIVQRQLEMLVTHSALQQAGVSLEALLRGWLAARGDDKLRVAFERLADSQAKSSGFWFDDSLLHACNALESLHAAWFDGSVSEDADMIEKLTQLQDLVRGHNHEEGLLDRLRTTRRKSFPAKTQEIVRSCVDTGRALLEAYPDMVADINKFRTRAAHASTEPRDVTGQIDVLIGAQWLLRHALLQALGIPVADCDEIILPNFTFKQHLRRLQERHLPDNT